MTDKYVHCINGVEVPFTEAEITARKAEEAEATNATSKLKTIKEMRNQKLKDTDWMANSDVTMSEAWQTKRQAWRDIPQNNTTEEQYDSLLARDENGNLTNTIWSDA